MTPEKDRQVETLERLIEQGLEPFEAAMLVRQGFTGESFPVADGAFPVRCPVCAALVDSAHTKFHMRHHLRSI